MTHRISVALGLCLALALVAGVALADSGGKVVSGPQVGQKVPGPFHPLNVTGAKAGEKNCLYCQNGTNPVAMVFAREASPQLAALVKKLDACTAKNSSCEMGSFVVFLSDEEGLDKRLKAMAEEQGLRHIVLSIDNPQGPQNYKVSRDADVTVVLYKDHTVKANHAFRKGQLKDKDIERVVADVSKITSDKGASE
jgi:hypothetical protein